MALLLLIIIFIVVLTIILVSVIYGSNSRPLHRSFRSFFVASIVEYTADVPVENGEDSRTLITFSICNEGFKIFVVVLSKMLLVSMVLHDCVVVRNR